MYNLQYGQNNWKSLLWQFNDVIECRQKRRRRRKKWTQTLGPYASSRLKIRCIHSLCIKRQWNVKIVMSGNQHLGMFEAIHFNVITTYQFYDRRIKCFSFVIWFLSWLKCKEKSVCCELNAVNFRHFQQTNYGKPFQNSFLSQLHEPLEIGQKLYGNNTFVQKWTIKLNFLIW